LEISALALDPIFCVHYHETEPNWNNIYGQCAKHHYPIDQWGLFTLYLGVVFFPHLCWCKRRKGGPIFSARFRCVIWPEGYLKFEAYECMIFHLDWCKKGQSFCTKKLDLSWCC